MKRKIRIGINGFGRIGRLILRIVSKNPNFQCVAINNGGMALDYAQFIFTHDTIHGKYDGVVEVGEHCLIVDGNKIEFFEERDPALIPWNTVDVDYVVDSTGVFRTREDLIKHIQAGAKKVVLSAPGKEGIPLFVFGVNEKEYTKDMDIVSNASCTTNCLAPLAKIINNAFGIEEGLMTTVHSATATQKVVDGNSKKDYRGGRAASYNIIPSSTGAAKSVGEVIPELKGKLTGMSFRVPTINVSVVDLTCRLKKPTTYEEIVETIKKAENEDMKGIVTSTNQPVVSSDFIGDEHATIFDITAGIMLSPTFVKLVAWYDNEWGYSVMLTKLIEHMASIDNFK